MRKVYFGFWFRGLVHDQADSVLSGLLCGGRRQVVKKGAHSGAKLLTCGQKAKERKKKSHCLL
jgi:hypothetical protein